MWVWWTWIKARLYGWRMGMNKLVEREGYGFLCGREMD